MITARFYAKKLSHNVWFCFLPSTFLLASPWKLSLISQFSSSSSLMMITFAEKSVLVARVLTLYQRNSDMFKNCHAAGVCGRPCSVSFTHLLINGWYTTTSPLLYIVFKRNVVAIKSLVSRYRPQFTINTSHSAYAATETESLVAKIDGLFQPNFL